MSLTCGTLRASKLSPQWSPRRHKVDPSLRGEHITCRTRHSSTPCCELKREVTVIGGGAAGLTAAYFAAKNGAQVTVLERCQEPGRKILISGGTRCNVLPFAVEPEEDYVTESSFSALRSIFSTWSLPECKLWLEDEIGIALAAEEASQKWFPLSNSAREVRDKLVDACMRTGVQVRVGASVEALERGDFSGTHNLRLADGTTVASSRVVVATGGLSFPKMGTDGTGHRIMKAAGHVLAQPYPALTPLTGSHPASRQLAGISLPGAELRVSSASSAARGTKKRGKAVKPRRRAFLFTHKGFSGPAVLDLSHLLSRPLLRGLPLPEVQVNWTGEGEEEWSRRLGAGGTASVSSVLRQAGIPSRLTEALTEAVQVPAGHTLSQLRKGERTALLAALTSFPLACSGHEGFGKAEVTGGGGPLGGGGLSQHGERPAARHPPLRGDSGRLWPRGRWEGEQRVKARKTRSMT
eukprot:jgi/Botrbrau1/7176/Bobra.0300s0007.2